MNYWVFSLVPHFVYSAFARIAKRPEYSFGLYKLINSRTYYGFKRRENIRAYKILWKYLNKEQRHQMATYDRFVAIGSISKRCYLIGPSTISNIHLLKNKYEQTNFFDDPVEAERTMCVHPDQTLPLFDVMLAQKLLIESDEATFISINYNPFPVLSSYRSVFGCVSL